MQKQAAFRKGVVLTPEDFEGVDWIGNMEKAGLNTLGLHSGGGQAHDVLARLKFMADSEFQERALAAGIDYEYELHASSMLLDRALFASSPDYFVAAGRNRERTPHGNWCVGNPEALELVATNAEKLARRLNPSTRRHFFWGADSVGDDWCHCCACAAMSPADQNLVTANAIARRLRQSEPQARVACLAYLSTLEAPRLVTPEPGVFSEFAPYRRCYHHALDDAGCSVNRQHLSVLLELLEVFPAADVHVLEYWLDSSLFGFGDHPPVKSLFRRDVVKRDLSLYYSLGVRSVTTFAVRMDGEYFAAHGDREFLEYAELINAL